MSKEILKNYFPKYSKKDYLFLPLTLLKGTFRILIEHFWILLAFLETSEKERSHLNNRDKFFIRLLWIPEIFCLTLCGRPKEMMSFYVFESLFGGYIFRLIN